VSLAANWHVSDFTCAVIPNVVAKKKLEFDYSTLIVVANPLTVPYDAAMSRDTLTG
jgi:hypothetical protein